MKKRVLSIVVSLSLIFGLVTTLRTTQNSMKVIKKVTVIALALVLVFTLQVDAKKKVNVKPYALTDAQLYVIL